MTCRHDNLPEIRKIIKCGTKDYSTLVGIWERAVRATHGFLDEETLQEIKEALIPAYFPNVDLYAATYGGKPVAFIGLSDTTIEMLFVDNDSRGRGYGSLLVDFARRKGATKVDVNEQNPVALKFYQSQGFVITGRDETDDAGRPYPILHLALDSGVPETATAIS